MTNLKTPAILALTFSLLTVSFTACTPLDDNSPVPTGAPPASGVWKVSYFFDKSDETSNYTGYTFEFFADGQLIANQGSQSWNGTWTTGFDDSKNKFLINFPGTHPSSLEELEEDWLIIEQTDSFMHFEHTSGGNGDTDILQLSKN